MYLSYGGRGILVGFIAMIMKANSPAPQQNMQTSCHTTLQCMHLFGPSIDSDHDNFDIWLTHASYVP